MNPTFNAAFTSLSIKAISEKLKDMNSSIPTTLHGTGKSESKDTLISNLVDIIKKRNATFSERSVVSKQLAKLLGIEQPLLVAEAIAEICYNVDICAQATSKSDVEEACKSNNQNNDEDLGSPCYLKSFREQFKYSPDFGSMTMQGWQAFARIIDYTKTYYGTLITNKLIEYYKEKFNVDLSTKSNFLSFKNDYPEEMNKPLKVSGGSLALGSYTGEYYRKINRFLYSKNNEKLIRYYNLYAAIIDTLEYFPEFKKKVNRGVNLPAKVLKEHHKVGNIVCYDGFTSTAVHSEEDYTSNPRNGFLTGNCTQRLYISYENNGAKPGRLIKSASLSVSEEEVLFEPGTCFRVDKVSPRTDEFYQDDPKQKCKERQRFNFELTVIPAKS